MSVYIWLTAEFKKNSCKLNKCINLEKSLYYTVFIEKILDELLIIKIKKKSSTPLSKKKKSLDPCHKDYFSFLLNKKRNLQTPVKDYLSKKKHLWPRQRFLPKKNIFNLRQRFLLKKKHLWLPIKDYFSFLLKKINLNKKKIWKKTKINLKKKKKDIKKKNKNKFLKKKKKKDICWKKKN